MNYNERFKFKTLDEQAINSLNEHMSRNPNTRVLINIPNTRGVSSEMIKKLPLGIDIRVAGGYNEDRVKRNSHSYYETAVIYTRNETVKIVEEMEALEKGIDPNWSQIQKSLYIYNRLKSTINYDPEYETKDSDHIRSLRGLVSKNTVCAGYALMFKEMLNRQGIDCQYVEGGQPGEPHSHAWNLIRINGEIFPVDLTWDTSSYRRGDFKSIDYFANIDKFIKSHIPDDGENLQDYYNNVKGLKPEFVNKVLKKFNREREYNTTTYSLSRDDGTRATVSQVGTNDIDGKTYCRYLYADKMKDGKLGKPVILYSETNIAQLVDSKNFNRPIPDGYEEAVYNVLLSVENINDSLRRGTYYIGGVRKNPAEKGKVEVVKLPQEIQKSQENIERFNYPTKQFTRSDGSTVVMQQMLKEPMEISGVKVMQYDCFETVNENGKPVVKKNTVYSEKKLFNDTRQEFADDFLSRSRLDRKVKEAGGYIGYFDKNGIRTYNPDLVESFKNKAMDFTQNDILSPSVKGVNLNANTVGKRTVNAPTYLKDDVMNHIQKSMEYEKGEKDGEYNR